VKVTHFLSRDLTLRPGRAWAERMRGMGQPPEPTETVYSGKIIGSPEAGFLLHLTTPDGTVEKLAPDDERLAFMAVSTFDDDTEAAQLTHSPFLHSLTEEPPEPQKSVADVIQDIVDLQVTQPVPIDPAPPGPHDRAVAAAVKKLWGDKLPDAPEMQG
jgi:hypothetical protein